MNESQGITNESVKDTEAIKPNSEELTRANVISDRIESQDTRVITESVVNDCCTVSNKVYNIQNLKPFNPNCVNTLSTEEAQRRGRNGGKKSGEVRRQRKTMRESILAMLEKEISPEKLAEYGLDSADMSDNTYQSALIASMLREALNGSEKALAMVRDTIGEAPTLKTENRTEVITAEDVKVMENFRKSLIG
jgi:hypothetical protein